jgi:hypothetical protein
MDRRGPTALAMTKGKASALAMTFPLVIARRAPKPVSSSLRGGRQSLFPRHCEEGVARRGNPAPQAHLNPMDRRGPTALAMTKGKSFSSRDDRGGPLYTPMETCGYLPRPARGRDRPQQKQCRIEFPVFPWLGSVVILLLDTHLLLWAASQPDRLSATAKETLMDENNALWFSAASLW